MYVRVDVYPGAKKEHLKRVGEERLEIMVKEPAAQNLANQRVRELVADFCGVTAKQVRIISGHHSGSKILSVKD